MQTTRKLVWFFLEMMPWQNRPGNTIGRTQQRGKQLTLGLLSKVLIITQTRGSIWLYLHSAFPSNVHKQTDQTKLRLARVTVSPSFALRLLQIVPAWCESPDWRQVSMHSPRITQRGLGSGTVRTDPSAARSVPQAPFSACACGTPRKTTRAFLRTGEVQQDYGI